MVRNYQYTTASLVKRMKFWLWWHNFFAGFHYDYIYVK